MTNLNRMKCAKAMVSLAMECTTDDGDRETRANVIEILDMAWGMLDRGIWNEEHKEKEE